ncbi:MAG: RecX family transcriptional regulator [Candidatus Eremiobacteraeota bacterium]|nr:RecX family transcriptional regulator [Candidatus Eremiobacteraeota bacterium]
MTARVAALRVLAQRRLTEAQLWQRLERRGFAADAISAAVAGCKADGYLDDRLFAELHVCAARKPVGDVRLIAQLVQKGIDPEVARGALTAASQTQARRCERALDDLERRRPGIGYPSAARALERLGFPASVIYATLRERIAASGLLISTED